MGTICFSQKLNKLIYQVLKNLQSRSSDTLLDIDFKKLRLRLLGKELGSFGIPNDTSIGIPKDDDELLAFGRPKASTFGLPNSNRDAWIA